MERPTVSVVDFSKGSEKSHPRLSSLMHLAFPAHSEARIAQKSFALRMKSVVGHISRQRPTTKRYVSRWQKVICSWERLINVARCLNIW